MIFIYKGIELEYIACVTVAVKCCYIFSGILSHAG